MQNQMVETFPALIPEIATALSKVSPQPIVTLADLTALPTSNLSQCQYELPASAESAFWYSPSSFDRDRDGALFLIPHTYEESWENLDALIKKFPSRGVLNLLPSWWQLEPLHTKTIRENGLPMIPTQPQNIPLAVKIIELAEVGGIVTTADIAIGLHQLLQDKNLLERVRFWLVVSPSSTTPPISLTLPNTYTEMRFAPGNMYTYQCPHAPTDAKVFHLSEQYFFEILKDYILLTSIMETPFPLIRYRIDTQLTLIHKNCVCGKSNSVHII